MANRNSRSMSASKQYQQNLAQACASMDRLVLDDNEFTQKDAEEAKACIRSMSATEVASEGMMSREYADTMGHRWSAATCTWIPRRCNPYTY